MIEPFAKLFALLAQVERLTLSSVPLAVVNGLSPLLPSAFFSWIRCLKVYEGSQEDSDDPAVATPLIARCRQLAEVDVSGLDETEELQEFVATLGQLESLRSLRLANVNNIDE